MNPTFRHRRALFMLLLSAGLAAGCATPTLPPPVIERPTQPAPADASEVPTREIIDDEPRAPERAVLDDASDATVALVGQAYRDQDDGEPTKAVGSLERAIRLEPRNGQLWILLAEMQLAAGRTGPAEQSARKGLLFVARQSPFRQRAWLVIASALDSRGEHEEAAAIRADWGTYRG